MGKNAIVLSGGGSKGAYEIGVLIALSKIGFKYDIVTGTSVGCINGVAAVQKDIAVASKMWKSISTKKVFDVSDKISYDNPDIFAQYAREYIENNGFSCNNLKATLETVIDEKKFFESEIDFALVTVGFPHMTPKYIYKSDIEKGKLIDYVMASAACFPAVKPYKIEDKLYIDGGYNNNLPTELAINLGATNIVEVDLQSIGRVKPLRNKNVKIKRIRSYNDLGNFLIFDKKTAKKDIKIGYLDTLKAFGYAEGFKYTFRLKETSKIYLFIQKKLADAFLYYKGDKGAIRYLRIVDRSIKNMLNFRGKSLRDLPKKDYFILSYETCLDLLDVPVFERYTKKKADFVIKREFNNIESDNLAKINDILSSVKTEGNLLSNVDRVRVLLSNLDSKQIVKYLVNNFDRLTKPLSPLLVLLAICKPNEFVSAFYIKCLYE